jgi:hypothetical protein
MAPWTSPWTLNPATPGLESFLFFWHHRPWIRPTTRKNCWDVTDSSLTFYCMLLTKLKCNSSLRSTKREILIATVRENLILSFQSVLNHLHWFIEINLLVCNLKVRYLVRRSTTKFYHLFKSEALCNIRVLFLIMSRNCNHCPPTKMRFAPCRWVHDCLFSIFHICPLYHWAVLFTLNPRTFHAVRNPGCKIWNFYM